MRRVVAVLIVGGCALATARLLPQWHDDRALWTAAAGVADRPRAAVNLARIALLEGDVGTALTWDTDALDRTTRSPETRATVTQQIRSHLRWILVTSRSTDICDGPPWASWCASL